MTGALVLVTALAACTSTDAGTPTGNEPAPGAAVFPSTEVGPLIDALPPVLIFDTGDERAPSWIKGTLEFAAGEISWHDLENIGQTPLQFVTVEFKESGNAALPI